MRLFLLLKKDKNIFKKKKMPAISFSKFLIGNCIPSLPTSATANPLQFTAVCPLLFTKFRSCPQTPAAGRRKTLVFSKSSETEVTSEEDEWLKKLPEKKKPLYSHSLPCVESWLKSLGFCQSREDRALWLIEKPDWHAQLSLDITDLYIRYLKSGPGNLEKDVERRFSYALSREDIENAILEGS